MKTMSTMKFYKIFYKKLSNARRIHNSFRRNVGRTTQQGKPQRLLQGFAPEGTFPNCNFNFNAFSKICEDFLKTKLNDFSKRWRHRPLLFALFTMNWDTLWFLLSIDHLMYHVTFIALLHILRANLRSKSLCSLLGQYLRILSLTGLVYTKTFTSPPCREVNILHKSPPLRGIIVSY